MIAYWPLRAGEGTRSRRWGIDRPGTGAYGQALKALAAGERSAYVDMTTPWAEYIRSAKVHPHLFYRDVVHANEYGEQILAKILMAFWAGRDAPELSSPP